MIYDVVVVGAGVIGAMTARELTRYKLSVCLLEKESDVATGASKANSGIIHGGFDPEPDTLKARLNTAGVPLLYEVARELNVPHRNNGSLVVAFGADEEPAVDELYSRGIKNGIEGMQILSGDQARELEPKLSAEVTRALLIPTAGIICPYALTVAAAGNAIDNGAELIRGFELVSAERDTCYTLTARDGRAVKARRVINCAGGYSGKIAELFGDGGIEIIPRAGEYMLLDKAEGKTVDRTVFQVPTAEGKGVLVTPTADGNLLLGPTAQRVASPDSTETTDDGLNGLAALARKSVPTVNTRAVITSFAGVRSSVAGGDFIIRHSEKSEGVIHAAAVDSPGLTCCVAIAKYIVDLLGETGLTLAENDAFDGTREDTHAFRKMTDEEKDEYIKAHPAYGKVICRCETVSEGEILDALRREPRAVDLDGVKRRTRSGMGRCQGGFCTPYIMKLIAEETGIPMTEVTKKGGSSKLLEGRL